MAPQTFFVYVLYSYSTGNLYIGQTKDLTRRLTEHQSGLARYLGIDGESLFSAASTWLRIAGVRTPCYNT
ncbi:MAG: GIY-YIG nuclease family protein [Dehalococcoidia bacterium]